MQLRNRTGLESRVPSAVYLNEPTPNNCIMIADDRHMMNTDRNTSLNVLDIRLKFEMHLDGNNED